jgi:phosphoribosylanthranilate isomerase
MLKGMNIHALDVNSGVERWRGNKDIEKIRAIQTKISNLK